MLRLLESLPLYCVRRDGRLESYDIESGAIVRTFGSVENKVSINVEVMQGKYEGLKGGFLRQDCTEVSLVVL